jgi:hypothetical protein
MKPAKVYLDTNIYKFSATQLPRLRPRQQTITWGDIIQEATVHDFIEVDPNEKIQNQELKNEAELLPKLAELGKKGAVRYCIQVEALLESWGIPNMDSRTGKFYGAPVEQVEAPVKYGRVIIGGNRDAKEMQFNFLSGLNHKRFTELQELTGAYQGPGKLNRNQLLECFLDGNWLSCEALLDERLYAAYLQDGLFTKEQIPNIDWNGDTDLVLFTPFFVKDLGTFPAWDDVFMALQKQRVGLPPTNRLFGWFLFYLINRRIRKLREKFDTSGEFRKVQKAPG